ncbi:MAG: LysM peptidoglycan-binding domain-containing protein [Deltaproteobacteria bacterium]|nr:LysM peptidoglycan-binding domain-containing protein [Deltaproteobacteria bacterium]
MVDSPKDTREDFVISNGYDEEEEGDLGREDSYSRQTGVLQNILFVFILSGSSDGVKLEQLQALEKRIEQLEKRMATLGVMDQALERIDNSEKELGLIMERVDRFEGTVTTQIDQIIKELGKLHQKTGSAPAPKAKAAQPVAKSTTEKKMRVHEVSAGETLYSISRRYGLTVDQLRKYNNIGKDTAIRPGQKLKLSPP